jgi:hypothetical protein
MVQDTGHLRKRRLEPTLKGALQNDVWYSVRHAKVFV